MTGRKPASSGIRHAAILGGPVAIGLLFFFLAPSPLILALRAMDTGEPLRSFVRDGAAELAILEVVVLVLVLRSLFNRMRRLAEVDSAKTVEATTARQGLEAALAANSAKSRYLASVSHELRAPLNVIFGYAQLLERGGELQADEAARVIRRSAEHLNNLVEGLLDMSLVENGMMRLNVEPVRFVPFVDQIASMFRHGAAAKGLQFRYVKPDRLPEFVRMDQRRLRQILINLLSNAIKFTQSGAVSFTVRWSGQVATFEIADTGPGVPEHDRERIFAPFERGEGRDVDAQPGVGLGLAISASICKILGGDLSLESSLGEGSCFRVKMMLPTAVNTVSISHEARVTGYEGPRRSILLVDDDLNHLTVLRTLLQSLGFDVATATDGATALSLSNATKFNLAILDISMPGLSGWEVARLLRATSGAMMKIVMLSGNALERDTAHSGAPVHDLFLVKPVALEELVDAVGDQLGLVWTHGDHDGTDVNVGSPAGPAVPGPVPDAARPHINKLRELVKIGYVRGLEEEIRLLAKAAPEAGPLADRLLVCLDRFDLAHMDAVLREAA